MSSCEKEHLSQIDGFWKLSHVVLPDQTSIPVDSQFYAFQEKYVFSHTLLYDNNKSSISYGYADYPQDNQVHIQVDPNHLSHLFLEKSFWKATSATFTITTLNNRDLVLQKGDTLFYLKRF